MRIDFIFTGTFWGIMLILFGLSAILKTYDIHFPFARIIFALIFIYIGVAILVGGPFLTKYENTALFNKQHIKVTDHINDEYNIIFGKGTIDLTDIQAKKTWTDVEINTVFGSSKVLIDSSNPIKIKVSSAFAGAQLPDGSTISFGDYTYTKKGTDTEGKLINIEASVVFGNLEIIDINQ